MGFVFSSPSHRTPSPLTQSSIGGHVRHSLDHFRFLVDAEEKCVDYDTRNRGTTVETDPAVAAAEIDALCGLFCEYPPSLPLSMRVYQVSVSNALRSGELTEDQLGQDLRCSFMMSGGGDRQEFESGRRVFHPIIVLTYLSECMHLRDLDPI